MSDKFFISIFFKDYYKTTQISLVIEGKGIGLDERSSLFPLTFICSLNKIGYSIQDYITDSFKINIVLYME